MALGATRVVKHTQYRVQEEKACALCGATSGALVCAATVAAAAKTKPTGNGMPPGIINGDGRRHLLEKRAA